MMQFAAPSATKVTAGHSLVLVLGLFLVSGASAWGGLFNRYNPSMLSNLNLGYGKELYGVAEQSAGHPHNDVSTADTLTHEIKCLLKIYLMFFQGFMFGVICYTLL